MDIFDFVLYVKMRCRAHKLLIATLADPKLRDTYISKVAFSVKLPVEKVEEALDRLAKTCWIICENTTEARRGMGPSLDGQMFDGSIDHTNPLTSDPGGYKSGKQDGRFDIMKFFAGTMECYGRLLKEKYND